jgi:hypothetical protein
VRGREQKLDTAALDFDGHGLTAVRAQERQCEAFAYSIATTSSPLVSRFRVSSRA